MCNKLQYCNMFFMADVFFQEKLELQGRIQELRLVKFGLKLIIFFSKV